MLRYNYENLDSDITFTMGNEKPFRSKRKAAACEDAESVYKREIQNLSQIIRRLKTEQANMADLPPTERQTSAITDAIDSGAYVSKEIEIGVKIRDLEKKLASAKKRFRFLFGYNY